MSIIKVLVKGTFATDNFLHEFFDGNNPPPKMDIIETQKEAAKLLEGFDEKSKKLIIQSSNGKGSHIKFELRHENISNGGSFRLNAHANKPAIIADIDAEFTYELDTDTAKELKKANSSGALKFYLTNLGARWETETPYAYSSVSGKIEGGEWGNDSSWPAISNFESDAFTKKSAVKAKPNREFALKGEGVVEVSAEGEKEYAEALVAGEDLIWVCVKTSSFNSFPIMRSQLKSNDSDFMVNGGFEVERIGKSRKYKVRIDGIVSTESLKKKDIDAIAAGTAICTLEKIGSRGSWNLSDEYGNDQFAISVAPKA